MKNNFKNKKNKGFSLLELLVVLAIIGIMTGASFAFLGSSRRDQALKAAQAEVTASIKLAQSYALQGKTMPGVSERICGYGFRFVTTTRYQIIYYYTSGPDCTGTKTSRRVERQDLKNNVTLKSPGITDTKIFFSIPSATVSGSGVGQTLVFELGDETRSVTIGPAGLAIEN